MAAHSHDLFIELSFETFGRALIRSWWLVLIVMCVTIILVWRWIGDSPIRYEAVSLVEIIDSSINQNKFDGPTGALGLLANLGTEGSPQLEKFEQLLGARALAERVQDRVDLMGEVFDARPDPEDGGWTAPRPEPRTQDRVRHWILRKFGFPIWNEPDIGDLANFIEDSIEVDQIKGGLVRIFITGTDPNLIAEILPIVIEEADRMLWQKQFDRVSQQIDYLDRRLDTVTKQAHRRTLIDLLSNQEQTMMLLQAQGPFSFQIIDPPNVPTIPVWPRPVFMLALSVMGGLVFGVLAALILALFNTRRLETKKLRSVPVDSPAI